MSLQVHSLQIALSLLPVAVAAQSVEKPNVLFILTDDQGWGDVCINGNPQINTPAMDRLHNESVVMNRFFVSPLSAPTRASILTGRYHLRTGVSSVQSGLENMRPEETTLAELFKDAGYKTGCFGKWHNGTYYPYTPNGQGFDEFLGFCCGHWANYFDPMLQHNETVFRGKGYITEIFTDAALDFIEQNKNDQFFCYVPYNAPHSPFMLPDRYFDKYKNVSAANQRDKDIIASIYGMVECVDDNIARLLSKLDELGIRDNTIVVFMTDNGPVHAERYNGGMRGIKGTVHEGGVRVPCFISWQGHLQHAIIDRPAAHVDLLPTLMELCGITDYKTAFPIDGVSLAKGISNDGSIPDDRKIFTHRRLNAMDPAMGAVRGKDYRMAIYPDNRVMMFDMKSDPSERNDIYDSLDNQHRDIYKSYMAWYKEASKGVALEINVPVGYDKAPQVRIPTPEGLMYGNLKCYGYPNQNWVNHFTTRADSLACTLDVVNAGNYEIVLEYNHLTDNKLATAYVQCSGKTLKSHVEQFVSVQTSPKPRVDVGEAPEKSWGHMSLGTLKLKKGFNKLTIFADGISDKNDMQIKTIIINKK